MENPICVDGVASQRREIPFAGGWTWGCLGVVEVIERARWRLSFPRAGFFVLPALERAVRYRYVAWARRGRERGIDGVWAAGLNKMAENVGRRGSGRADLWRIVCLKERKTASSRRAVHVFGPVEGERRRGRFGRRSDSKRLRNLFAPHLVLAWPETLLSRSPAQISVHVFF